MFDRKTLLALAITSLFFSSPSTHCYADPAAPAHTEPDGHHDRHEDADDKKDGDREDHERKEKEIEQPVPMNFVPPAILDAVKKEVPNGTITKAELEAKRDKIMYAFDVTAGDMKYEVKITVDGKFFSKKVDDDEKGDHENKSDMHEKD